MGLHFGNNNAPDRGSDATYRGNDAIQASDTPTKPHQKASHGANPHAQLIKDHCNGHNTWIQLSQTTGPSLASTCTDEVSTRG